MDTCERRVRASTADLASIALPTDNDYGIPVLRLDRQATAAHLPFARWGRERRKSRMRGTWHFYTEDYRFEALWRRWADVPNSGCVAAVEPNFSVHAQHPRAVAIWQTYRKRFLGRLWQDHGVALMVDLNVAIEHAATNALGVPKGWRAYCTRGALATLYSLDYELDLARSIAGTSDVLFVVYGGGKAVGHRCRALGLTWFAEAQEAERGA